MTAGNRLYESHFRENGNGGTGGSGPHFHIAVHPIRLQDYSGMRLQVPQLLVQGRQSGTSLPTGHQC